MADNDGNPSSPTNPGNQQPPQLKPVAPAPRANPPNVNTAKETPVPGGSPAFGDFMEWMRSQMAGATPGAAEAQRTLIPKEKKKFQRRDIESKSDRPATPPDETEGQAKPPLPPPLEKAGSDAAVKPVDEASLIEPGIDPEAVRVPRTAANPATADTADPLSPRMRRGQQAATKRNSWAGLLVQFGVLALLAGSFVLGRVSVSRTAPASVAAPAAPEIINQEGKATTNLLSDANAALIDQAMHAEQSSDFKTAKELFEKVRVSGEHVHGLAFQRAQLAVFAQDNFQAPQLLNDAITVGEEIPSIYTLRATLAARGNNWRGSPLNDYETAAKADPFDARTFYYWGTALRGAGKLQAALVRFHQALDRLREPTAEGYYRLQIRLTQIELGQDGEFADELAKQMALPNPSIDWLFTAAALKVRDGRLAEAAALLTRAEQGGDPEGFSLRLRDYFFNQHSYDKELKPFFDRLKPAKPGSAPRPPPPAPSASASPMDATPPAVGLDVPTLPPPASPGATVAR